MTIDVLVGARCEEGLRQVCQSRSRVDQHGKGRAERGDVRIVNIRARTTVCNSRNGNNSWDGRDERIKVGVTTTDVEGGEENVTVSRLVRQVERAGPKQSQGEGRQWRAADRRTHKIRILALRCSIRAQQGRSHRRTRKARVSSRLRSRSGFDYEQVKSWGTRRGEAELSAVKLGDHEQDRRGKRESVTECVQEDFSKRSEVVTRT